MRRILPSRHEQEQRGLAYLTDDRVPAEERGRVMLALVAHAGIYLLLSAAEAIWVVAVAVRVWRRREAGVTAAVKTGVHKPTLAVLLGAQLAYVIFRRVGLAKFNRRTGEYAVQPGESG
jgi:uncharacterized membrane protein YdbT with pleckstrin-like domain